MFTIEGYLLAADELVAKILSQWDLTSTALAASIALFSAYLLLSQKQPDTHPMLLARQAQPSPVRQPGQSAVYRSHTSPHGTELNGGLNVRDQGGNKWGPGRNGDLRDVWRRIVEGKKETGEKGRIITVLGSEEIIYHDLSKLLMERSLSASSITLTIPRRDLPQHQHNRPTHPQARRPARRDLPAKLHRTPRHPLRMRLLRHDRRHNAIRSARARRHGHAGKIWR